MMFHAGKHFLKMIIQEGEEVEEEELSQDSSAVTSPVAPVKKSVTEQLFWWSYSYCQLAWGITETWETVEKYGK